MAEAIKYNHCEIHIGEMEVTGFNQLLAEKYANSNKIIITDENVYELWGETLITSNDQLAEAEIIQIPPGEEFKTIEICEQIWAALSEYQIGRDDVIINFGGGVVCDLGGFIASTFKRGLDFINVPTTLLSQVDASLGGKTGVDFGAYKNQIGVFSDPEFVFIDTVFLQTLDENEIRSGFAEMLKHGLIADQQFWYILLGIDSLLDISHGIITTSVLLKKEIIETDYRERGARKKLNFGHTIGHALESYLLQEETPFPHGHCIAQGMIAEAFISLQKEMLSESEFDQIRGYINSNYEVLPIETTAIPELIQFMENDKKNEGGEIQFSLLKGIGNCDINQTATEEELFGALTLILSS